MEVYILLIIMIVGAIVALEVKDLLSSIVAIGTVGLMLTLTFLVLKAPDLAIVQLVVEILTLVILLRATISRDTVKRKGAERYLPVILGVVISGFVCLFAFSAIRELPEFGSPLMNVSKYYIGHGLSETGATNLVSSIILNFRAYDTLGEAVVLLTAVIGAFAVLRKVGRKHKESSSEEK